MRTRNKEGETETMKCPRCGNIMKLRSKNISNDWVVSHIVDGEIVGGDLITVLTKIWECNGCKPIKKE